MADVEAAWVPEAFDHLACLALAVSASYHAPYSELASGLASAYHLEVVVEVAFDKRPFSAAPTWIEAAVVAAVAVVVVVAVAAAEVEAGVVVAAVVASEGTCFLAFGPCVAPSDPSAEPSSDPRPSRSD